MTNTVEKTSTDGAAALAGLPVDEVIAAALDLARAGRWSRAAGLLDATAAAGAQARARLALAAAEVAVDSDLFSGTSAGAGRLRTAAAACAAAGLDPASQWDLAFLRLRHGYFDQILGSGGFRPGPAGKDPGVLADIRSRAGELRDLAPDGRRRGWAEMYLGLIADNLYGDREAAPAHYEAALRAGESGAGLRTSESGAGLRAGESGAGLRTGESGAGLRAAEPVDDLLTREALRHLGDHDHDRGDDQLAFERWGRATALGARAGAVPGTLSQQMLLAVLARATGDEAGATALAREIARWATALGATRIATQATAFLAGADPTAPPKPSS
jgi:hypothetical protein